MAYTINYLWPNPATGPLGSTPPTAQQAAQVNSITATIYPSSSADGQLAITHNFGAAGLLSNADISNGFPDVGLSAIDQSGTTDGFWLASQNINYAVVNRTGTGFDTAPRTKVRISLPNTLVR